jgi:hypothetical protein
VGDGDFECEDVIFLGTEINKYFEQKTGCFFYKMPWTFDQGTHHELLSGCVCPVYACLWVTLLTVGASIVSD